MLSNLATRAPFTASVTVATRTRATITLACCAESAAVDSVEFRRFHIFSCLYRHSPRVAALRLVSIISMRYRSTYARSRLGRRSEHTGLHGATGVRQARPGAL